MKHNSAVPQKQISGEGMEDWTENRRDGVSGKPVSIFLIDHIGKEARDAQMESETVTNITIFPLKRKFHEIQGKSNWVPS